MNDPWATQPNFKDITIEQAKEIWPNQQEAQQALADAANPMAEYDKMNQDQVLLVWDGLKKSLAEIKEKEMEMRKYVVKRAFPNPTEGTNTVPLGNGYELKSVIKYNYKLTGTNEQIEEVLDTIALTGNEGSFIAGQIITWSPEFHKTKYTELKEAADTGSVFAKKIIDELHKVLTIEDAAPTLNIKEPKVKK